MKTASFILLLIFLSTAARADVIISPRRPHKNPADAGYQVRFTPHFGLQGKALVLFGDNPQEEEIRGSIIPPNTEISLTIVTYYPEASDSLALHAAYLLVMDSSEFRTLSGNRESVLINRQKLWEMGAMDIKHLLTQQDIDNLFAENKAVFDLIRESFAVLPKSDGGYYLYSAGFSYSIEEEVVKTVRKRLPGHQPGGEKKKVTQESGILPPGNALPAVLLAALSMFAVLWIAYSRERKTRPAEQRRTR